MPHETEILANESGIQYQGVNDASSVTGDYPIQGLMTGIFKRGRFDRPMTIHKGNIKAMLGFEPKNPYYLAVQDALDSGVPSVQVLRLKGGENFCVEVASYYYRIYQVTTMPPIQPDETPKFLSSITVKNLQGEPLSQSMYSLNQSGTNIRITVSAARESGFIFCSNREVDIFPVSM